MSGLPKGTITFLFTDIEGSTRLWEQHPQAMRRAQARHDAILEETISANSGRIFRTGGDSICAAFSAAPPALLAATAAQRALFAEDWGQIEQLRVRVVLHTGAAEVHRDDYVGASLNLVGRLLDDCHGGQTLLSMATEELVRRELPEGVALCDLGWHRFRGFSARERVFQVDIAGLPDHFPPLKSRDIPRNNLPAQLTSFIGRGRELAEARQLLEQSRLLTLTGPGGAGKTRLSLQLAKEVLDSFDDGTWIARLARISDPDLIPHSIVSTLGAREQPGHQLLDTLIDYLRPKSLLLILDNCEHLIDACAQLANTLLQACPELKIVASSREALGIAGETSWRVPPLSMPVSDDRLSLEEIASFEAVQLFVERAQNVQPQFTLGEDNAMAVLQICRQLDGIPLAIELAASRVRLLSPEQIAGRLEDRFRLLTGGSRAALPHQQTLRASIDWSYDLLAEAEQTLLRRLSVFYGGWSFQAAEFVAAEPIMGSGPLEPLDVLDLTGRLVDKSLVSVDSSGGEPRYFVLETIRLYAAEKLLQAGESSAVRDRHLSHYIGLVDEAEPALYGPEQLDWLKRLDEEHDNLLAALRWAAEGEPAVLLHLAASLGRYWGTRVYVSEGRKWLNQALARLEASDDSQLLTVAETAAEDRAKAYRSLGVLAIRHGEIGAARSALEVSVRLYRALLDVAGLAYALSLLALSKLTLNDAEGALQDGQEGITLARRSGNQAILSYALSVLGRALMETQGDQEVAGALLEESVAICRQMGARWAMAIPLRASAVHAYHLGDFETARSRYKEAQTIFGELGDLYFENICRSGQADIARNRGEIDLAITLFRETLKAWQELGHRGGVARCLECLAYLAVAEVNQLGAPLSDPRLVKAARMLGAAEIIRKTNDITMTHLEQEDHNLEMAVLKAEMNPSARAAAWAEGRALSLEQAAAYALADDEV